MNRLILAASLVLAFGASSFAYAQNMPQTTTDDPAPTTAAAPTTGPMPPADAEAAHSMHSTHRYHGAHHYPARTRGGAGDPRIVDHSADHLVVEPTHTTVTVQPKP